MTLFIPVGWRVTLLLNFIKLDMVSFIRIYLLLLSRVSTLAQFVCLMIKNTNDFLNKNEKFTFSLHKKTIVWLFHRVDICFNHLWSSSGGKIHNCFDPKLLTESIFRVTRIVCLTTFRQNLTYKPFATKKHYFSVFLFRFS